MKCTLPNTSCGTGTSWNIPWTRSSESSARGQEPPQGLSELHRVAVSMWHDAVPEGLHQEERRVLRLMEHGDLAPVVMDTWLALTW